MRAIEFVFLILFVGTLASSEPSAAAVPAADADGWHSWQVDEANASTEMCCFTRKRGDKSRGGCNLDGHNISFSNNGDCSAALGTLQVYVLMDAGRPKDIRVLSSNCPVSTATQITDHGLVSSDDNIGWFRTIIEDRDLDHDVREEALFALVLSESDAAYAYLDRLLTSR